MHNFWSTSSRLPWDDLAYLQISLGWYRKGIGDVWQPGSASLGSVWDVDGFLARLSCVGDWQAVF